jgi:Ca2+-binding RTX toxin-like protein
VITFTVIVLEVLLDGNDKLYGGTGDDTLTGGGGPDYFDCGQGLDTITDFNSAEDTKSSNCEE